VKKIEGSPRFDAVSIVSAELNRTGIGVTIKLTAQYLDTKTSTPYGAIKMSAHEVASKETQEAMTKFIDLLESDVAATIFNQQPATAEGKKEGLHEPTGLADEAEEDAQV